MDADDLPAFRRESGFQGPLHFGLRGPADFVRGLAQITAGDQLDLAWV
jgi:hypothetical protein